MINKMSNYSVLIIILVILIIGGAIAAALTLGENKKNDTSTSFNNTYGIFDNTYHGIGKDSEYDQAIKIASQRWTRYIREDITVPVTYNTFHDSQSSILARASMNDSTNIRAGGTITINIGVNSPRAGWDDVIEHELCHVLGLPGSTKWQNAIITKNNNSYLNASVFTETAVIYRQLISGSAGNIPLQPGGAHWEEGTFTTELMTPTIGTEIELITSKLTLTAMKELGWDIDINQAEDF